MKKNATIILVIIILSMLFLIKYISNTLKEWEIEDNLRTYSVYYAKNMPHSNDKHPVLIMLIDNLKYINKPEIDKLKYKSKNFNTISYKYSEDIILYLFSSNDINSNKEYSYNNKENIKFTFDKNLKLKEAKKFREHKYIDISTINEQEIIAEIYELVQPIIDAQPEPEINLQEEFNKRYKEQFS